MKIGQILAYVDGDNVSQDVIERFGWLAENLDADIELFTCAYDQHVESEKGVANILRDERERLESLAKGMQTQGASVSVDAAWTESLDDALLEKARKSKADLVAKQTHDRTLVERILLTDEDWNLILECPVPLLLAKNRNASPHPTVLAAIDPTHDHDKPAALDRRILDVATKLGEKSDASVHAVHIVDTVAAQVAASTIVEAPSAPVVAPVTDLSASEDLRNELVDSSREAFNRVLGEFSTGAVQSHLLEGDVAAELAKCAADLDADFVVMGAVSRGLLENAIIGHTARRVMDQIQCDLVVVK